MTRNRSIAMVLIFGSLLYSAGCDNSFTPEVDLPLSPEAVAERVRVVQEFYQTALEKEQSTPLKFRKGIFKAMDDSSNVSGGLDDSTIVVALAEMVRQYPPDWENAETWDNGNGGYFFATLLGKNVMDIRPEDTKIPVVRTLIADVTLDGDIVPGSMHLIEFAGRGLDVTRFKDYVNQWLVSDFQDTPILVAEYTIGYASTVAFLYEPGKEPTQVTMALRRYNRLAKDMTFDLTICYTEVDYELECDDEKKTVM